MWTLARIAVGSLAVAHARLGGEMDVGAILGVNGAGNADGDAGGDASAIQKQLSEVIAQGNERLQEAEQEHEKVLKKIRTDAADDFASKAQDLGAAAAAYTADLDAATKKLETAINATQKGLDAIGSDLDITTKAKIGAKIGVAQRKLRRVKRTKTSQVEQAGRRAESALDHEADSLMSLWVGDLSKPLADAKEKLHEIADAPPRDPNADKTALNQMMDDDDDALLGVLQAHGMADSTTTTTKATTTTTTTTTTTSTKAPTAKELESKIEAAQKDIDTDNKAADKKLSDAIAKANKDTDKKIADVKKSLKAAEKKADDTVKAQ